MSIDYDKIKKRDIVFSQEKADVKTRISKIYYKEALL